MSYDLLAELQSRQAAAAPAAPVAAPAPALERRPLDVPAELLAERAGRPRPRRRAPGAYQSALGAAALLVALALVAGVWFVGARFTLGALASWGLPVVAWGLLAWSIPLAISALEAGALAARSRAPALWLLWAAVLGFDVFTTAAGLLEAFTGAHIAGLTLRADDPSSWAAAGVAGLFFALGPEPMARQILRELWA